MSTFAACCVICWATKWILDFYQIPRNSSEVWSGTSVSTTRDSTSRYHRCELITQLQLPRELKTNTSERSHGTSATRSHLKNCRCDWRNFRHRFGDCKGASRSRRERGPRGQTRRIGENRSCGNRTSRRQGIRSSSRGNQPREPAGIVDCLDCEIRIG